MTELDSITSEWHPFGIQLGVDHNKLTQFEKYTQDVKYYLSTLSTQYPWYHDVQTPTERFHNSLHFNIIASAMEYSTSCLLATQKDL